MSLLFDVYARETGLKLVKYNLDKQKWQLAKIDKMK
jgi:hypothetical protein